MGRTCGWLHCNDWQSTVIGSPCRARVGRLLELIELQLEFTAGYNSIEQPTFHPPRSWRRRTSPCQPTLVTMHFEAALDLYLEGGVMTHVFFDHLSFRPGRVVPGGVRTFAHVHPWVGTLS